MEKLKNLTEICQADSRQEIFLTRDENNFGSFRKITLEDFHRQADDICLHEGIPEKVRDHFQTARNLIIYSWFYYPFNVTAQLHAYISVKYALRIKCNDSKTNFKSLLKKAADNGWIKDHDFPHIKLRDERARQYNQSLPAEYQTPESQLIESYCDNLVEIIPSLRNDLAHGSSMLHEQGAFQVRICADLINQLFPPPHPKESTPPTKTISNISAVLEHKAT